MRYLTSSLIDTLENKIEQQITFTVKVLQNLSADELTARPTDGGWNIMEILDHLNSYGNYYLPLIKLAIEKSLGEKSLHYKSGFLGDYFVRMINPETGAKKMRAAKRHLPQKSGNPELIVQEFIRQEELLLQYVFKCKTINLSSTRIPISITKVIRLKLGDILLFLINHIDRHLSQINMVLEASQIIGTGRSSIIVESYSAQ